MMSLFDEPSRQPLPQPGLDDYRVAGVKSLVSAIPFLGGAGSELIALLSSPVGQRRDEWVSDLERRLREMEQWKTDFHFDDLSNNEQFVSATLQATQTALRTRDEEKLSALRNAVLNVAAGSAPEDHFQDFYLSLIDTLTPTHLRMLRQFKLQQSVNIVDSPEWLKSNVAAQIAKDLLDRGLLGSGPGHHVDPDRNQLIIGRDGVYTFHAAPTLLGNEFLSFITNPVEHD